MGQPGLETMEGRLFSRRLQLLGKFFIGLRKSGLPQYRKEQQD